MNGFMQPQVYEDDYFEVETNAGTEIVPGDLVCTTFAVEWAAAGTFSNDHPLHTHLALKLAPFVEGSDIGDISPKHDWLARMSAPGYMDCTAWSAHETQEEAVAYLEEMYGDDDDFSEQGED